jgi:hypothetical protein
LTEELTERKNSKASLRKRWNDDVITFNGVLQASTESLWDGYQTSTYLHSLHDFYKELPEDPDMGEQDIPGLQRMLTWVNSFSSTVRVLGAVGGS